MIELYRKFLMGAACACIGGASLIGCGGNKPPVVVPTPPPPVVQSGRPDTIVGQDQMIRTQGAKFVINEKPHAVVGTIPCWPTDGTGDKLYVEGKLIDYWWPLVSPDWIEYTGTKGGNMYHMRPGPFDISSICCGLEDVGAPYAADGSWNTKFWDRYHVALRAAVKAKANVEVDVLDGWIIKHAVYGDVAMPWPAEDVHSATSLPFNRSVKTWVLKNVYESCNYANVVYQIGNENQLMLGWTPEWERAMYALIREAEKQPGCVGVVHAIGSNTEDWEGPYEYFASHDAREGGAPVAGRPMSVNEYNPHMTPATFHQKFCEAKAAGQAFWYWRSDGTDEDQNLSLNSLNCDEAPQTGCNAPLPDRDKLVWSVTCATNGICDPTPTVTASCEFCDAIGMGEMGGIVRCTCPARNECPPDGSDVDDCKSRLACEQYLMEAPSPVVTSDGEVQFVDDNKFRAKTTGTWLEFCNGPGTKCKKVYP